MTYWDAALAFLVAMAVAVVLTPIAARIAKRWGTFARPSERGLAVSNTPVLGGLAILAGVLVAAALWMPAQIALPHTAHARPGPAGIVHTWAILAGAGVITLGGLIDDIRD